MNSRRNSPRRLLLEELEGRLVPSTTTSLNWSGYAVTTAAGAVTSVSSNWVVPTFTSTSANGYSASWVGIDGYNSNTVEQIGTEADYLSGRATYYAWYEMYPNASRTISTITVSAGDTISGQVSWAAGSTKGGTYTLTLTNNTSRQTDTVTINSTTAFQRSSAEWIMEAPSLGGILPLAGFGTESFTGAQATISGTTGPINASLAGTQLEQINMVNQRGSQLDSTGTITDASNTSSFTVTFTGASSTGGSGGTGGGGGHHHHHGGGGFSNEQSAVTASQAAAVSTLLASTPRLLAPTVTLPAAQPAAVTTSSQVISPAAPSAGLAALGGGGENQSAYSTGTPQQAEAAMPEVPPDGDQPEAPAAPSKSDANSDAAPMPPAAADEAAGDAIQLRDACFMDGRWVPVAPGDGANTTPRQDDENGSLPTVAGVLFTFSLGSCLGIAREQAAERRRRLDLR
jgi:peptidase A4-like protein